MVTTAPALGLQSHFYAPPETTTERPGLPLSPSLVGQGITHEHTPHVHCPNGRWLLAICREHGNERWIYRPCKKRRCPVCGVRRRKRVAWRIANGLELLSPQHGGGWFVGTWANHVDKTTAVKSVARFVARLRRNSPKPVDYACTWERTTRGRLHVNLVFAPWTYIPQRTLSAWWRDVRGGRVVWIKRVGAGIGQEAAKSRECVAAYFSKWEQMIDEGRAATYSKGWPKLPDTPYPQRKGKIDYFQEWQRPIWVHPPALEPDGVQMHLWQQPHEYEYKHRYEPWCDCFQLTLSGIGTDARSPPIEEA